MKRARKRSRERVLGLLAPAVLALFITCASGASAQEPSPSQDGGSELPLAIEDPLKGDTAEQGVVEVKGSLPPGQGPGVDPMSYPSIIRGGPGYEMGPGLVKEFEKAPGVSIIERGADEGPWRVMLRGAAPKRSAVYLDGLLMSAPLGTPPDLSQAPYALIDQVRVYKGGIPQSYPAPGTSGLVDLRTMPPSIQQKSFGTAKVDSLMNLTASAGITGKALGGALVVASAHNGGPARFEYTDNRGTWLDQADDREMHREHNEFTNHHALAKWDKKLENTRIYIGSYFHAHDHNLPGPGHSGAEMARESSLMGAVYAGVDRPGFISSNLDAELRVHALGREEHIEDREGELGPRRVDDNRWRRAGAELYGDYFGLIRNSLSMYLGVFQNWYVSESELFKDEDDISYTRFRLNLAASDEIEVIEKVFKIKPQVRSFFIEDDYKGPTLLEREQGEAGRAEFNGVDGGVSSRLTILPSLWLVNHVGLYSGAPGLFELYGDRAELLGNPGLGLEQSIKTEAGLVYRINQVGKIDLVKAGLTLYQNDYYNSTGWVKSGDTIMQAVNIGEARASGIEASVQVDINRLLFTRMSYSLQETENLSDIPRFRGKVLPMAPRHAGRLDISIQRPYAKLYYRGTFQDQRYLDPDNTVMEDHTLTHDLGLVYFQPGYRLGFEAENVNDDRSREAPGYPLPGARYIFFVEVKG